MTFGPIKTRKYEEMTPTIGEFPSQFRRVQFRAELPQQYPSGVPEDRGIREDAQPDEDTGTTTRTERRPVPRKRTSQPRQRLSDQPRTGRDQFHPHDLDDHRRRRRTKTIARQTRRSLAIATATATATSCPGPTAVSAPPAAGLQPQNTPPPPRLGENAARRTISRPDPVAIAVSLYGLT